MNLDACRVCLKKSKNLNTSIFQESDDKQLIADKIMLCGDIKITPKQNLPNKICKKCLQFLDVAYNFRKLCKKSDNVLQLLLNKNNRNNIIVSLDNGKTFKLPEDIKIKVVRTEKSTEIENKIDGEHDNSNENKQSASLKRTKNQKLISNRPKRKCTLTREERIVQDNSNNSIDDQLDIDDDDDDDDENDYHFEYLDKDENINSSLESECSTKEDVENCEEIKGHRSNRKEQTSSKTISQNFPSPSVRSKREYILKTFNSLEKSDDDDDDYEDDTIGNGKISTVEISPFNHEDYENIVESDNNGDANVDDGNNSNKEVPVVRIRIREFEKPNYICELCGNSYKQRCQLILHMKRHRNEKNFACEICGQLFLTNSLMARHLKRHTGYKPFKCSYCTRTFYEKGMCRAHEKIHSGARPYVCRVCNKSFIYSQGLTKHMLIHDEIKLYNCETCNKEFRLKHHLTQHFQTLMHQNAVANKQMDT